MSWSRRFLWAFWIFVITMLLWQFYVYNEKISTPDPAHPQQGHFFFYQPTKAQVAAQASEHDGPYVEQTGFTVSNDTPTAAMFTCHVTLKNTGKQKAINVQARVRPFRGTFVGDPDGHDGLKTLDDNSPLSQFGKYVDFPDLDPGQSCTEDAIFMKQSAFEYGKNPSPEIIYQPEKKH